MSGARRKPWPAAGVIVPRNSQQRSYSPSFGWFFHSSEGPTAAYVTGAKLNHSYRRLYARGKRQGKARLSAPPWRAGLERNLRHACVVQQRWQCAIYKVLPMVNWTHRKRVSVGTLRRAARAMGLVSEARGLLSTKFVGDLAVEGTFNKYP